MTHQYQTIINVARLVFYANTFRQESLTWSLQVAAVHLDYILVKDLTLIVWIDSIINA